MSCIKHSKAVAGAIAGAVLVLTLGVGAVAITADTGPATPTASIARAADADQSDAPTSVPTEAPPAEPPTTAASPSTAPTTAAPTAKPPSPPKTATTRRAAAPTTVASPAPVPAPAPTTAPAPAKLPPGHRVPFTSSAVQAAAASLHQRIPLFNPSESQLRTFADAVCTSFDQWQTLAQVQSTVRQAVTHIQGASLSEADAAFAVRTVVQLRCPGWLA